MMSSRSDYQYESRGQPKRQQRQRFEDDEYVDKKAPSSRYDDNIEPKPLSRERRRETEPVSRKGMESLCFQYGTL